MTTTPSQKPLNSLQWFLLCCLIWWIVGGIAFFYTDKIAIYKHINIRHNTLQDAIMPWITLMGTAPVIIGTGLLILAFNKTYRNKGFLLLMALCNIIPFLLCQLIKRWVNAPRPIKFFDKPDWMYLVDGQPELMSYSFPSGHTAGAFAFFCFLTLIMPIGKRWIGFIYFLLAILVAYSRIYLSQHFYDDVYAGSILGTLTCIAIYLSMYKRIKFKNAVN